MPNVVVASREEIHTYPLRLEPETVFCTDRPLTVEEFYEMVDEDTNAELMEGVIVMKSPASYRQETLFSFLYTTLNLYVKERKLGQVLGSRTAVRITNHTAREPDLLFVSKQRLDIILSAASGRNQTNFGLQIADYGTLKLEIGN
ncbi:MAG: Uma2 family endonuclease [bacterium]|nr:Uma2 family endonuclease [bacterium]